MSLEKGLIMNDQTFVTRVNQALPIARTAKSIIEVFEKHHIFGFEQDPDLYVIAPNDSTAHEIAIMIVFRNAIKEAKYSNLKAKKELKRLNSSLLLAPINRGTS